MRGIAIKLLKVAVIAGGAMLVLRLLRPKLGERIEHMFEEAPEDFPPKWMYLNVSAIRENTERILELLTRETTETEAA